MHSEVEAVKTLSVLGLAFLVAYLIFDVEWLALCSVAMLVLALMPRFMLSQGITRGWLKFSEVLGNFNSKIILGITYYGILCPVALANKIFNPSMVRHFKKKNANSYFYDVKVPFNKESFKNTW